MDVKVRGDSRYSSIKDKFYEEFLKNSKNNEFTFRRFEDMKIHFDNLRNKFIFNEETKPKFEKHETREPTFKRKKSKLLMKSRISNFSKQVKSPEFKINLLSSENENMFPKIQLSSREKRSFIETRDESKASKSELKNKNSTGYKCIKPSLSKQTIHTEKSEYVDKKRKSIGIQNETGNEKIPNNISVKERKLILKKIIFDCDREKENISYNFELIRNNLNYSQGNKPVDIIKYHEDRLNHNIEQNLSPDLKDKHMFFLDKNGNVFFDNTIKKHVLSEGKEIEKCDFSTIFKFKDMMEKKYRTIEPKIIKNQFEKENKHDKVKKILENIRVRKCSLERVNNI